MKNAKYIFYLKALTIFLLFNSCIDDNFIPPLTGELNPASEMLVYFESLGDFPNSNLAPALVNAEEVFSNLSDYLIIDVRDYDEYLAGHIEGAVNLQNDSLFKYVKNINHNIYDKIVLVSTNGHCSAYYTCLLRLTGFSTIYSLNYGMASWNMEFAGEWLSALKNDHARYDFTNDPFPKGSLRNLPIINFENKDSPIEKRVEQRISRFIRNGFNINEQYRIRFYFNNTNFFVCYGKSRLYKDVGIDGDRGHQVGTVHYAEAPFFEFRAVQYLQTLPTDKTIFIYGYNGQLSACMVAYLRVLGYDAVTLNFGANQIFYSRMLDDPELNEYAFTSSLISNFPFVRGE